MSSFPHFLLIPFAAWIDINLIVNDSYMSLIYQFLGRPALRTTASETLTNILSKKMNSANKLELITFLNLTQVVNSLESEEDVEFSEAMAKLVNVQGLELNRILTEVNSQFARLMFLGCCLVRSRRKGYRGIERSSSSPSPFPLRWLWRDKCSRFPAPKWLAVPGIAVSLSISLLRSLVERQKPV